LPYGSSILPSIVALRHSGGQPSADGIRELAASRRNSTTVTRRLVGSYPTFSPLPLRAVVFFFRLQPSPAAGTFTSGASYAARTFLSCPFWAPAADRDTAFRLQRYE